MKSSLGSLLVFAGIVAPPGRTPVMHVARALLQITGMGFGIYFMAAFGLFLAGARMRGAAGPRRGHPQESP
ncbi:hypothetical protein [Actinomadura chibensis]|uniref:Uncharacterized protein n=1 Tax=Actinomadura chibensis TaxID=392828 RepID=A0A5D0NDC5_9ACTN|nr:hypothetical protein [Actinomadura chibensis]TYB42397.1 hypothetical protein FXF69_31790 [Actinomadura chibensis]